MKVALDEINKNNFAHNGFHVSSLNGIAAMRACARASLEVCDQGASYARTMEMRFFVL